MIWWNANNNPITHSFNHHHHHHHHHHHRRGFGTHKKSSLVSLRRYHQQRGGERLVVGVATVTAATTMMSCVTHTCKCEAASSSNDGIMNNNENKNNKNNNKNNSSNAIVAGAFAGAVARIFVAPLDVIKIRLQIQKENYSLTNAKYKGAVSAMATIAREEGIRKGLWAGTLPALCLWIPYTGIQFGMLNLLLTSSSSSGSSSSSSSSSNFVYGAVAGATATIATYPFDIIRTQLASQGIPKTYNGVFDAFYGLLRRRKLYAGLGITLIEIVPATSVQFGVYGYLDNKMNSDKNSKNHFAKGFIAGSCARVAIHPLDVMKKRLQVVGLKRAASYGAAETAHKAFPLVVSILKTEGPRGFYKGLLPALCKSAPSSAITFGVYEFAIRFLDNQQL